MDICPVFLAKYKKTGQINHLAKHNGNFGDFSNIEDYQTALDKITQAELAFNDLSSDITLSTGVFCSMKNPALNGFFIEQNTPVDRVIAVTNQPHFLWDGYFNLICARPVPTYSLPGLIDHF